MNLQRRHWLCMGTALALTQARHAVPLVVFSHGIGGSRLGYTWLGRNFARHGIASLHLQHVGSDRSCLLYTSPSPRD